MRNLFVLLVIAFALRVWFVSDHNIIFWFDQARDAIQATQLWQGNLKLMGPSASGTNDTVYHGVLYYYLISPWYGIFGGDPTWASYFLGFLGALAIPLNYWLGYAITQKKSIALALAFLFSFSAQAVVLSTLLGNPTIALVAFPLFFLSVWKLFYDGNQSKKWWLVLGLSYGWLVQAAIWLFPLIFIPLISLYLLYFRQQKSFQNQIQISSILIAMIATLLMTSSMILTQIKLANAGVFTLQKVAEGNSGHERASMYLLTDYVFAYGKKITSVYFPSHALVALLVFVICATQFPKLELKKRQFYLLVFLSPILISIIFPRNNDHFFFMIDLPLYLLLIESLWLIKLPKKSFQVLLLGIVFLCSNIFELQYLKHNHLSTFDTWGSSLKDSLALVDYTYAKAGSQPFTIDTYTEAYRYNTIWSYLYSWYGKNKYGSIPAFTGMSQAGMIHHNLLPESTSTKETHFAIVQPNVVLPQPFLDDFLSIQDRKTNRSANEFEFGTLKLFAY